MIRRGRPQSAEHAATSERSPQPTLKSRISDPGSEHLPWLGSRHGNPDTGPTPTGRHPGRRHLRRRVRPTASPSTNRTGGGMSVTRGLFGVMRACSGGCSASRADLGVMNARSRPITPRTQRLPDAVPKSAPITRITPRSDTRTAPDRPPPMTSALRLLVPLTLGRALAEARFRCPGWSLSLCGCPGGLVACDSHLACAAPGTDPGRERLKKGMLCH